jgi:tetratricopeptide (TPR) repeat protein
VRLFFWPARLSAEYGPPAYSVGDSFTGVKLVGAGVLVVAAVAAFQARRVSPIATWAIGWMVILLIPVSNVLFPSGVLLAERTLFAASMGACVLVALVIARAGGYVQRKGSVLRTSALVAAGSLLVFGVSRSIVRQSDWRDNESLFKSAVAAEPMVYRSHYMLGAWYLETDRWPRARAELIKAMNLFDRDPAVAYNLGIGYLGSGDYQNAFQMFEKAQTVMPGALDSKSKMALALAGQGRLNEAKQVAVEALRDPAHDPAALRAIIRAAALAEKTTRKGPRR